MPPVDLDSVREAREQSTVEPLQTQPAGQDWSAAELAHWLAIWLVLLCSLPRSSCNSKTRGPKSVNKEHSQIGI